VFTNLWCVKVPIALMSVRRAHPKGTAPPVLFDELERSGKDLDLVPLVLVGERYADQLR
jgi:hypothetical protein